MKDKIRSLINRLRIPIKHSFNHVVMIEDLYLINRERLEASEVLQELLNEEISKEDSTKQLD